MTTGIEDTVTLSTPVYNPINFEDATIIPALIDKISSNKVGGWTLKLDVPEIAQEQIKQLIGTECKRNYLLALKGLETIVPSKKRPGRPKSEE